MVERLTYKLMTILGGKNPSECQIYEVFEGNTKILGRFLMEKVPRKSLYVILKQDGYDFPEILDARVNIKCASDKVLEYALRYVQKRIDREEMPLLIIPVVENFTNYNVSRFKRVKKRLEKKVR